MNINIEEDLWATLAKETRPIVLYGMGDGAEKIVATANQRGIKLRGFFSSSVVHRKVFGEWTTASLEELEDKFGSPLVVLVAFGTAKPEVMAEIEALAEKHIVYLPDLPVAGEEVFDLDYYKNNKLKFEQAYNLFSDTLSRALFEELISYKLTGNRDLLSQNTCSREEMFSELFTFGDREIFVDAGAYQGDTIEEFISNTKGSYKKIYALEPEGKNYRKLRENLKEYSSITFLEAAAWSEDTSLYFESRSGRSGRLESGESNTRAVAIDSIVGTDTVSYIKYDVEGAEYASLTGSRKTIAKHYPKLLVSVYHRREDLFYLPLYIKEIAPDYKFYLRRNPSYPAWDINLICIKG